MLLRFLPVTKTTNILPSRLTLNFGGAFYKATAVEIYPTVKTTTVYESPGSYP